jgi:hypothetical protein
VIAKSEANHARLAVRAGAAGIFLAIANAQAGVLSESDYAKFSEPFDKMILDAVKTAPLNVLHLHTDAASGDKLYASRFYRGWPAAAINYTLHTRIPIAQMRREYPGVILAGLDERAYRSLSSAQLKEQTAAAPARRRERSSSCRLDVRCRTIPPTPNLSYFRSCWERKPCLPKSSPTHSRNARRGEGVVRAPADRAHANWGPSKPNGKRRRST